MLHNEQSVKNHLWAAILTVIAITFMTIYAELNETFKNWLKDVFYHHWLGKGVLALALFVVLAHLIKINSKKETSTLITMLISITIVCALLIVGFFVWESL